MPVSFLTNKMERIEGEKSVNKKAWNYIILWVSKDDALKVEVQKQKGQQLVLPRLKKHNSDNPGRKHPGLGLDFLRKPRWVERVNTDDLHTTGNSDMTTYISIITLEKKKKK